jgi:plasmid maintenance system killer protein
MRNQILILGLLSLLFSSSANADSEYHCTIQRTATAEATPNTTLEFNEKNYIGKQFSVERKTGIMSGALKNSCATKPQVIDSGSKDNAFKVVTTMRIEQGAGAGSNIYALTINEYDKSPKKPFIFLNNGVVFFSACEHF